MRILLRVAGSAQSHFARRSQRLRFRGNDFFGILVALGFFALPAVAAGPHYPLQVSGNHRYLVDQLGAPFLVQGDAPWSLISGTTESETEEYLRERRRMGFNTLVVNLIEHKFHGPRDREGNDPFLVPGDFTTPNEKYFAHADWVIRKAGESGMQVLLAPIYLGYKGSDEGWYEEALRNGPARCREWGRFVGRRYKDFPNIIWLMGGDRVPEASLDDVNAVAEGIREFDSQHLFSAHSAPEHSAADSYSGWLTLNSTYTYGIVHQKLLADYHRAPVMPFILIESTYEGEHNASEVQIRRQAYWAVLCGGTGQVMGNRPIWGFDAGWQQALRSPAALAMSFLNSLFNSRPWFEMVPDQDHITVTEGLGEFNGLDTLAAARASDGSSVLAYMPSARMATVDMTKISGNSARAWWFNPRDGTHSLIGTYPNHGAHQFTPPGEGDWVLVLDDEAKQFPAPAAAPLTSTSKP